MRPRGKVKIKWSPNFAYAIGLLATDGNLSSDGRHISMSSKDKEQLENFLKCLGIKNTIGTNRSGARDISLRVQIGDIKFYDFLVSIGLIPAKSKTIGELKIPDKYFFDFLRGHFDGDGTFYSYWDPRWRSSFMFYVELGSASKNHIIWLQNKIKLLSCAVGRITKSKNNSVFRLKFAKAESLKLLPKLYYNPLVICLSRKRKKVEKALASVDKKL